MRLFISIDLPDSLQQYLAQHQLPLDTVKWSPPERLHMTLVFLGEQPTDKLPALLESLSKIRFKPFTLQCQHLGWFDKGVIWLGIEEHPALLELRQQILSQLDAYHLQFRHRRFTPHITLGRCQNNCDPLRVVEQLEAPLLARPIELHVDHFTLKSSYLHASGALHKIEASFAASQSQTQNALRVEGAEAG